MPTNYGNWSPNLYMDQTMNYGSLYGGQAPAVGSSMPNMYGNINTGAGQLNDTGGLRANGVNPNQANNLELGMNVPTLQLALGGLQSLGNLWGAYNSNKLAKKQLNFTMDAYKTNLANQTKTYNTTLEDRTRARGAFEGQSQAEMDAYNKANRL